MKTQGSLLILVITAFITLYFIVIICCVCIFLAATKQLYETSVCQSVCHTFLTMFLTSYHHEIFIVITIYKSGVDAQIQGQRSKAKVKEVMAVSRP